MRIGIWCRDGGGYCEDGPYVECLMGQVRCPLALRDVTHDVYDMAESLVYMAATSGRNRPLWIGSSRHAIRIYMTEDPALSFSSGGMRQRGPMSSTSDGFQD